MCVHVGDAQHWTSRNGSLMRTSDRDSRTGAVTAEVVHATDEKFPVGTVVRYQSFMGHVLCHGEGNDSCDLHPLDAETYINNVGGPIATFLGHGYWTILAYRKQAARDAKWRASREEAQAERAKARAERERVQKAYDAIAADFIARFPPRAPACALLIDGIGWPPKVNYAADERARVYTVSA